MTPLVVGTGFVGQGIIQRLCRDRDHGIVLMYGQLDDLDELAMVLGAHTPDVIVLAAGSPRHSGFRLDRRTLIEHVMVAERVAAYAEGAGARVVYVSSTLALQPVRTTYGALKLLVEHVVAGPRTMILRAGTVIEGANDRNQSVLHTFVRAVAAGRLCPIHEEAVGRMVYLVTRDHLADEVARRLTSSVSRGPSVVAMWQGTVYGLARLVTARWRLLVGESDPDTSIRVSSFEDLNCGMISTIDAMLVQASKGHGV